jgi:indole-3-glycerol phosphate synthase
MRLHGKLNFGLQALGASAVTLPQGLLGTERMRELQSFTEALGMECLAQVSNAEEISEALSADVKILVVVGKQVRELASLPPLMQLQLTGTLPKPSDALELKAGIPEGVVSVVEVPRRSDEGFDEIEDCWAIRDVGFTGVWVCEILYKAGQVQAENVSAIIKVRHGLLALWMPAHLLHLNWNNCRLCGPKAVSNTAEPEECLARVKEPR